MDVKTPVEGERLRPIWKSAGLHLTHRLDNGWLAVTPDFLRAYYTRPEIHPIDESCENEHKLFEKLMETPDAPVSEDELAAIADADAADNYRLLLGYRDHLLKHGSLEAGYLALFAPGAPRVPPVFIEQLVHLICSNVLAGEQDAWKAYTKSRDICEQEGDYVSKNLFEALIADEEGHIDFLETQLELLSRLGEQKYGQLNASPADA